MTRGFPSRPPGLMNSTLRRPSRVRVMLQPTVLIVEDDAIVAEDLAIKVRSLGYGVAGVCSTGEDALEAVQQRPPDLVLLDLQLAGSLDGIQTAEHLKPWNFPIIFVTAHSDRDTVKKATACGVSGYIHKPFVDRDLAIQIDIALYKAQASHTLREQEAGLRRAHDQLAQEAAALQTLNALSSRLWRKRTLAEGLEEMLAAIIELLGADKGNIQIITDRAALVFAAQQGFDEEFLTYFEEVSAEDQSACGRALRSGERIIVEDVETDHAYAPFREMARRAGYRAVQSTPLISHD